MTAEETAAPLRVDDHDGGVRVLTLQRPQRMNAFNPAAAAALRAALRQAADTPGLRVLVLTGAGGNFCTGADLKHRREPGEEGVLATLQDCHTLLVNGALPCIAAIEGAAYGAGLSLALACDRIVAAPQARFCAPFTGIGLLPDVGMLHSLPRRVGWARARAWMVEGTVVDAATALRHDLVDELADAPGDALSLALQRARLWAGRAPLAVAALRQADAALARSELFALELDMQARLAASADFAEAVAAFADKRPARFQGR